MINITFDPCGHTAEAIIDIGDAIDGLKIKEITDRDITMMSKFCPTCHPNDNPFTVLTFDNFKEEKNGR